MKFNFLIILLTSLTFLMISCDDSGNPSGGTKFEPSGTWSGEFKNSDSATVSVVYDLDSDNTYWMHMKLEGDVRYREEGDWIFSDSDTLQVTPTLTIIWNEMLQQLEKTYFNTPPYIMAEEEGSFRYSCVIDSVIYSTLLVK